MSITVLTDGNLEMTPNVNDKEDFQVAAHRDPNNIEGYNYDLLSGMLIDPMGNGVDYEVAAPEEFRRSGGFVITDSDNAWYYKGEDLFTKLAQGETTDWRQIQ